MGLNRITATLDLETARRAGGACSAVEWCVSGEHLVQYGAEGEDVRTRIRCLAANLFRRHVARCSQHRASLGVNL